MGDCSDNFGAHACRARLHPISTGGVYDRDAPGSSGARDGGAHAQTTVAQTLVDACDSYDSATSLLSHTSMAAVSGAGATSVDSAGSSRAAGNAGGGVQRRKSMSVAPPPRALSPAPRQAAVLAAAVMAPRQVPSPFMTSAAAQPLPPGVSPPSTAASPALPEAAPQPPAPAAAAGAGRPDGMDCADGPSVAPMAAALASPMPSAMPRRSLSSSGLAQVDTGGDGGDGSGGRRTGVVGVRSWEPRAQSMQLSAQMTAVARTTPGDDCSTLFDAMGRPVPLAHALSAAATDASTGVGRRHSKRQFARADLQVTNSFESTYAPGVPRTVGCASQWRAVPLFRQQSNQIRGNQMQAAGLLEGRSPPIIHPPAHQLCFPLTAPTRLLMHKFIRCCAQVWSSLHLGEVALISLAHTKPSPGSHFVHTRRLGGQARQISSQHMPLVGWPCRQSADSDRF